MPLPYNWHQFRMTVFVNGGKPLFVRAELASIVECPEYQVIPHVLGDEVEPGSVLD